MRVLLDTQTFLLAITEDWIRLPKRSRDLIADVKTERFMSTISVAEIAIKTSIGKLNISTQQVIAAAADLKLTILPFEARHAERMFSLPLHHREPFDRMILAVALVEKIPLVGGDSQFSAYESEGLKVIWQ